MFRFFITCSDHKLCHRRVAVCNLNILHTVVALLFRSKLFVYCIQTQVFNKSHHFWR
jgi:hypothetical protein